MNSFSEYTNCRLCPRNCGVNRMSGETGYCGETAVLRTALIDPHFGEEPSFAGTHGSGTIFLTGCSCLCIFCQNYQISRQHMGAPHSLDTLFKKIQDLIAKGVHNLNFVTPDHFWPHLRKLCHRLKECGESLPIIFNTSGYQSAKMITAHSQCADIFLSDFKFAHPELAEMCMGDRRYPEIAIAGLTQMVAEKGFLQPWDPSGQTTAREGVLVRHLVMPGHIENSLDTLRILRREFGRLLPLSVMSQYQPMPATRGIDGFNRSLTPSEYNHVRKLVTELEFEHVYIQELNDNTCFLPDFTQEKPFNGNS